MFTILQRSPPKSETKEKQKDEKKGVKGKEEISSQSSQETELDATLPDKGKKKKVQAKLDTSPKDSSSDDGSEDAATNTSSSGLPLLGSSGGEEHSPSTTDFLAGLLPLEEEVEQDCIALYLRKMGELKVLLYNWHDAKEYPELTPIEASEEIVDQYIERVLLSSHKWSNDEGVHKTLMEIASKTTS